MFIRYFATTDASGPGALALGYLRSLLRVAPVRLVTLSVSLEGGAWAGQQGLLTTPMVGPMVNVVCADPLHWIRTLNVPMPDQDGMRAALATGNVADLPKSKAERASFELYTHGVRNVLLAPSLPRTEPELETAKRYEVVVVAREQLSREWEGLTKRQPALIRVPVTDHAAIRAAITGVYDATEET